MRIEHVAGYRLAHAVHRHSFLPRAAVRGGGAALLHGGEDVRGEDAAVGGDVLQIQADVGGDLGRERAGLDFGLLRRGRSCRRGLGGLVVFHVLLRDAALRAGAGDEGDVYIQLLRQLFPAAGEASTRSPGALAGAAGAAAAAAGGRGSRAAAPAAGAAPIRAETSSSSLSYHGDGVEALGRAAPRPLLFSAACRRAEASMVFVSLSVSTSKRAL